MLPLSVDGLAASLVLLHKARNDRDAPGLARLMLWLGIRVSHGDELSRYALSVSEGPVTSGDEIDDHQVIIRGGQVEAVVVPLEEYRALKALEQQEAELYWTVHEARHPSRPGDDAPDGKVYDSMDALLADLSSDE